MCAVYIKALAAVLVTSAVLVLLAGTIVFRQSLPSSLTPDITKKQPTVMSVIRLIPQSMSIVYASDASTVM